MKNLRELFGCLNLTPKKKYPFEEGEQYFTIENNRIVLSCWDEESEKLHDAIPNKEYFRTVCEATKKLISNG